MNSFQTPLPPRLIGELEALYVAITQPCSTNSPQGEDISFADIYDQIQAAQQEDGTQLNAGEWSNQPKKARWKDVIELCQNALATQSKDLQLIVWLVRAYTRSEGFSGCYLGLHALSMWLEHWWINGYPHILNNDYEERIAKLSWLDKHLSHAIGVATISEDDIGALNWFSWEQSSKPLSNADHEQNIALKERWQRVIAKSHLTLAQQRDVVSGCIQLLTRIHQLLEEYMRGETTCLRLTEHTLIHMQRKLRDWTGQGLSDTTSNTPSNSNHSPTQADAKSKQTSAEVLVPSEQITQYNSHYPHNRSQMLTELEKIARYFRTYEPFGPTAPMLERALAWANKPVDEWLSELVSDETTRRKIEDVLGAQLHR